MIYNRTTWENSPSTSTPINAQNLNKIEQGITDAANEINAISHIVNVGTEVEEDSRINFIKSKNLFNKDAMVYGYAWNNSANSSTSVCYVECKPNTKYTINYTGIDSTLTFAWVEKTSKSATDRTTVHYDVANNSIFTTTATSNYIVIQFSKTNISASDFTNVNMMIAESDVTLDYEPYIPNQIVVDNETFTDTIKVSNEVDGRSRVNVLLTENIFNRGNPDVKNLYASSTTTLVGSSYQSVVLKVKPNTTYTIKRFVYYSSDFNVASYTNYPVENASYTNRQLGTTDNAVSITTGANDNYIMIYIAYGGNVNELQNVINNLKVVKGTNIGSYTPYTPPSINVDGEEIYSKAVVLWTNPNDTVDFTGAITLSDSLSNYSYYEVIYKRVKNGSTYSSGGRCLADKRNKIDMVDSGKAYERTISSISANTITYNDALSFSNYGGTGSTNNGYIVPVQIIGYK